MVIMKSLYILLISTLLLAGVIISCQSVPSGPDDIEFYTFNQGNDEFTPNRTPSTQQQDKDNTDVQKNVRNIVIDEKNNVFAIGIPARWMEKTEVTAQKPVDFWFEYLPDTAQLIVNNQTVQRDPTKWEFKISYIQNVKEFKYEVKNTSNELISYNLHIIPATSGDQVPAVVIQQFIGIK